MEFLEKLNKAIYMTTNNQFYSLHTSKNKKIIHDNELHNTNRKKYEKEIISKHDMEEILKNGISIFTQQMKNIYTLINVDDDDDINHNQHINKVSFNLSSKSNNKQIFKQISKIILGNLKKNVQYPLFDYNIIKSYFDKQENINMKTQTILPGGSLKSLEWDITYFLYMYFICSFPKGYIQILRKYIEHYIINIDHGKSDNILNILKYNKKEDKDKLVDIILAAIAYPNNKRLYNIFKDNNDIQQFIACERERQISRSMNGKLKIIKPLSKESLCNNIQYLYHLKVFANKLDMSDEEVFNIIFPSIDLHIDSSKNETIDKVDNVYMANDNVEYSIQCFIK
uniref:Uncharacterized protein n=1 Tax=Metapenaeus ensis majanivirus TaxID=2984279 RepID=A0A9C7BZL8_9VIRU|nr:MAG: hypothetical protein [Metapenaeus ensis majanivirus]